MLYSHVSGQDDRCILSVFLSTHYSRMDSSGWIREIIAGNICVNEQKETDPCRILKKHDLVGFFPGELPEPDAALNFNTVYEDPDLLVLDKPGNLCVHPTGPFFRHTLWHLAGQKYGELRFVHRLDRETSGLVIAARNRETAALMDNGRCPVRKEYSVLVYGNFSCNIHAEGHLIKKGTGPVIKKKTFIPISAGEPDQPYETSDTELFREACFPPDMTLVRAILHTGRQHQIRATLCSLGFPVVGDKLYGPDESLFEKIKSQSFSKEDWQKLRLKRQALHAAVLRFHHPRTGELIECHSPCPFTDEIKRDWINILSNKQ